MKPTLIAALLFSISCSDKAPKPSFGVNDKSIDASPLSQEIGDSIAGPNSGAEPSDPVSNTPEIPQSEKPSPDPEPLVWKKADLTNYESYPDPGSEECIKYSGCVWAGMFAALEGQQTESWVKENNIIAVHEKDFKKYKLKTFRLKKGSLVIDAKVYDMCADSDCNGCCTENARNTGFLIDIEKYTKKRFGNTSDGEIEWTCLDCQ